MTITKKGLIDAMRDLDDDAEIYIFCSSPDMGVEEYADSICFEDKVTGDDVTIIAYF